MDAVMENEYLKVTVDTYGGQLKSVIRKCDGVEHMWCADPKVWDFHAPILFPYCGPVTGNVLMIKGKERSARFHGFAEGMTHTLLKQGKDFVRMELTDTPETYEVWPFHFRLETTYHLEGDAICHQIRVENHDEAQMPFGFGFHPGFAIPFDEKHTASDYEIRFNKLESPLCIGFPHGLQVNELYSLGKNIRSLPINRELFRGPSHCMTNLTSDRVSVCEKDSSRKVTCEVGGFPYCLVWTAGGKDDPRFMCIEPWHTIPSPEVGSTDYNEKPATAILAPGEYWTTQLKIHFER